MKLIDSLEEIMKKNIVTIIVCLFMVLTLSGCGKSDAQKAMESAVETANKLIEKKEKPFDPKTKTQLVEAISASKKAKDDQSYKKVTKTVKTATKAYKDSIQQLKQITKPSESFLLERAKTVKTITKVEAATEKTDANKLMNKAGEYYAYIALRSSLVKDETLNGQSPVEAGTDGGAVIEAFKSVKDAKARNKYLSAFDGSGAFSPGSHKIVGILIVRTSNQLSASEQKTLENDIIQALIKL